MRIILTIVCFWTVLFLYFATSERMWKIRSEVRRSDKSNYVLPSKFSKVLALEHQGILSDYLLLKVITFFGERANPEFPRPITDSDWDYIVHNLDVVTDLDPYFLDPYLLAEGLLTWEAGRFEDANLLLKKGMQYRRSDWELPFFVGFNYFFFLKDNDRGAEYLRQASHIPGSPGFLPTLAARLNYYGGKTQTAAVFLKGIIAGTNDPGLRRYYERRLLALERAGVIEKAIEEYVRDHGNPPDPLTELVSSGYLDDMPEDPYGGEWVLMENGRIFSTSRFVSK